MSLLLTQNPASWPDSVVSSMADGLWHADALLPATARCLPAARSTSFTLFSSC
jgi:hypothetical protein